MTKATDNELSVNNGRKHLWLELSSKDLTQGKLPGQPTDTSPWFVKVLLAFSGWLASLFLLGFIAVALEFVVESAVASFTVGVGMITAAFFILNHIHLEQVSQSGSKLEFFEHVGLATSLAGQILVAIAVFDTLTQKEAEWLTFGFIQGVLALVMPHFVHRVISAFASIILIYLACVLRNSDLSGLEYLFVPAVMGITAWLWLKEFSFGTRVRNIRAIAYGFTLGIVYIKGTLLFHQHKLVWYISQSHEPMISMWVGELLSGVVLLVLVCSLLTRSKVALSHPVAVIAIIACILVSGVSLQSYGFSLGVMIVLLGFYTSNRVLSGLGVISLLYYISSYYYFLDITLLMKSFYLLLTGFVLLIIRWCFKFAPGWSDVLIQSHGEAKPSFRIGKTQWGVLAISLVVLAIVNFQIYKKEAHIEESQSVFLQLAPVDPRSLMQGDYMALRFAIGNEVTRALPKNDDHWRNNTDASDGKVIVDLNDQGVASFNAIDEGQPLKAGQLALQYRVRQGAVKFATNAFFFQEGHAHYYEQADYGQFKVNAQGELLLVAMFDDKLKKLGPEQKPE